MKELKEYIQNVNEIDHETNELLIESTIYINRLQINSKFHEAPSTNHNNFVLSLNDQIFECRRYIVCRLCNVSFFFMFQYVYRSDFE